jgi:hypothetical protein
MQSSIQRPEEKQNSLLIPYYTSSIPVNQGGFPEKKQGSNLSNFFMNSIP